ncbi:ABC transporter permease, partial [Gemmatimonadota bacterium]
LGGVLGLTFAFGGTDILLSLIPEEIPRMASVSVDWTVLGFTMFIAMTTGLLFGLLPALQSSGGNLMTAVREGGGKHTAGRTRRNLRNGLIIGEVAISLILLVGAGLMVRTFMALNEVNPGFDPVDVHTARVWIPESRYGEDALVTGFYREVIERMDARPEVEGAAAVLSLPIDPGISGTLSFSIQDRPSEPGQDPVCGFQLVSADYFRIMGIPLLSGRMLERTDNENGPQVAVINQALAEELWSGDNPLGKQVTWGDPSSDEVEWVEIVGIVGNTRFESLDSEPRSEIFRPISQSPMPFLTIVIKSQAEPEMVYVSLRQVVADIDADQPVTEMASMEEVLSTSLAQRRFNMQLLGLFALVALLMAAVGLYSVLSFSVAQRSGEIGVRVALGAGSWSVIGLIVRDGFRMVLFGLGAGIAGALLMRRLVSNMVYGVNALDPLTLLAGISLLAVIALLACLLPAWRAARIDPMVVLTRD